MNLGALILTGLALVLIAKCGGPASPSQQTPNNPAKAPCRHEGVGYAPVGRIFKIEDSKAPRGYGTHVLVDGSGNLQWILKSDHMNLDAFAGDMRWYRVEGEISTEHPDLFVVCLAYPSE